MARATGDSDLALHAAVEFNPGALDIVGYVMLSSRTADEALRRAARLIRLLNDGIALEITRERLSTRCRIKVLRPTDAYLRDEARQVTESLLAGIVHQLRLLTGRPIVPLAVSMRHPRPDTGDDAHSRVFGIKPRFNAEADEVTVANADVDVTLPSGNAQLLSAFDAHAESALATLSAADTLSGRVSTEIVGRLKGEAPTITTIAQALAMSARRFIAPFVGGRGSRRAPSRDVRRYGACGPTLARDHPSAAPVSGVLISVACSAPSRNGSREV